MTSDHLYAHTFTQITSDIHLTFSQSTLTELVSKLFQKR